MRKESKIKNLSDLRLEIARLDALSKAQESYLGDQYQLLSEKVAAPMRFVKSLATWVPGVNFTKGLFEKGGNEEDWLSRVLRIGLPVVLNRFFLRKAGFIKRALVTLLSQQAASALNKDTVAGLVSKVAEFIRPPAKRRRRSSRHKDYGIPPDSETY